MYLNLIFVLLFNVLPLCLGIPLEIEPEHDLKRFLSSRIVGGIDAPPGYGEHMAALVWGEVSTHLICGGSIVTTQHVLTAAHCIEPMIVWDELIPSFRAVVGSNKWASTKNNIRFTGYVTHPGFSWTTLKNDIGFLFLADVIQLDHNTAIIPLNFDWVDGGSKSYVTGWGRLGVNAALPDKLQMLSMYTLTPQQCEDGIREAASGWWGVPPYEAKLEICTLHSIGHGMCNGDSGSALVQKDSRTQIGIVSWGFPCALGAPDVFVRISGFKEWILRNLGSQIKVKL